MIIILSFRMALKDSDSAITFPKLVAVIVGVSLIFGLILPFLLKGIDLFFDGIFGLINLVIRKIKREPGNDR